MTKSGNEKYYDSFKKYWQGLSWSSRAYLIAAASNERSRAGEELIFAREEWLRDNPWQKLPPNVQKKVDEMRASTEGKDLYYRSRVEDEVKQFLHACNEERFLAWLHTPREQDMEKWDIKTPTAPPAMPKAPYRSKIMGYYR